MSGKSAGSVSLWIGGLKVGDSGATAALWDRYFFRLVALARTKLGHAPCIDPLADEEDAALSAFFSLCEGATRGRFRQLEDRNDLWRLLAVITARKATDQRKRQGRLKRGGGRVLRGHDRPDDDRPGDFLGRITEDRPGPELAAMLAEEYQRRLDSLPDGSLRSVARLRLEGYSNDEIAEALGCARRTVARKLEMVREAWKDGAT
ncbi:ECF-type sigma factor [Tundrisphaera lichenicola]|uniref:ECF-type sigma factor n=1 Tax=Tundrisphaera lichenicola TaxID=2029860 RepID=UPI003EB72750